METLNFSRPLTLAGATPHQRRIASRRQPTANRPSLTVYAAAKGKGFGSSSDTGSAKPEASKSKKAPKLTRYLDIETGTTTATSSKNSADSDWIEIPDVNINSTFLSKPIKPIILKTGRAIMLYYFSELGKLYCTDANSTAYQYPLADADILQLKSGPAVQVKLDGTTYDLATGKVLSWCPKDTTVRKLLGSLKDKTEPIDLPVYPIKADKEGKVFVKLAK